MDDAPTDSDWVAALPRDRQQPLHSHRFPDGDVGWFVSAYSSCRAILGDPAFTVSLQPLGGVNDGGSQAALSGPEMAGDPLRNDGLQHTRLRRLLTRHFTVRRVNEHRAAVERIVGERLDAMEESGPPVDFVQMFAFPVPSMMICQLLGVPHRERHRFEHADRVVFDFTGSTPEEKMQAMRDVYDWVWSVVERKRAEPSDDLLSELVLGGGLNDDELKGLGFVLFAAGHGTTADLFYRSTWFLLSERERWEKARANPSSIDRTVEELLRYLNPIDTPSPRTAREDVEVDGTVIKAGQTVALRTAAPSGDPNKLADQDRFDPLREPGSHLAFGHGRHICLGQHLARLELRVGLEALMKRFPTLHLAVPVEEVPWRHTGLMEVLDELPVAW
jgi:cytochrome P450